MIHIRPTAVHFFIFLGILLICGAASVQLGRQAGFDWLVYHHYDVYALLNHRQDFDVLPAGFRTFWNGLSDIPFYVCSTRLPAKTCTFIAGFVQGLNVVGAVVIAALVLARTGDSRPLSHPMPWVLAAAGALGATSIGLIGSSYNDNLISLLFLVALYLVCQEADRDDAIWTKGVPRLVAAGILVGTGCGLKLTLVPFGFGIVLAPVLYPIRLIHRAGLVIACGAAVAVGGLAGSGLNMLRMYHLTGNPLFPFFNGWFDTPFRDFVDGRDLRYLPHNLLEQIFFPLVFAFDPFRASELMFRDFRIPVLFVLALISVAVWLWRASVGRSAISVARRLALEPRQRVFLAVLAVGYLLWIAQPNVYRYLFPIELLSFVAIWVLLRSLSDGWLAWAVLAVLAVLIIPTTRPLAVRRLPWDGTAFMTVKLPESPRPQADAIVLMSGLGALTYAIPSFPPDVRFLGVDVMERTLPGVGEGGASIPATESEMGPFAPYLRALIADHQGQILGMFNERSRERAIDAFARYGLRMDPSQCGLITSNVTPEAPINLCLLTRG